MRSNLKWVPARMHRTSLKIDCEITSSWRFATIDEPKNSFAGDTTTEQFRREIHKNKLAYSFRDMVIYLAYTFAKRATGDFSSFFGHSLRCDVQPTRLNITAAHRDEHYRNCPIETDDFASDCSRTFWPSVCSFCEKISLKRMKIYSRAAFCMTFNSCYIF